MMMIDRGPDKSTAIESSADVSPPRTTTILSGRETKARNPSSIV